MNRRMLDPDFFTDEDLIANLDHTGRLFYAGLWVVAEDSGVFEPKLFSLKMKIFPGDNLDIEQINDYYEKLVLLKKIIPFEYNGVTFAWLRNFFKHQKLERPKAPTLPLPACLRWHGKEEYGDLRRSYHYEQVAQCPPMDGSGTALCCPCDGLWTASGRPVDALIERNRKEEKVTEEKRNGKEKKGKGTRAREAEQQQPVPPDEEAARLSSSDERSTEETELLRQRATGEISTGEYEKRMAALVASWR